MSLFPFNRTVLSIPKLPKKPQVFCDSPAASIFYTPTQSTFYIEFSETVRPFQ